MSNDALPRISEHILEVRYNANPKVLDYRGTWVEMIKDLMGLPHWQIVENRLDVFDRRDDEKIAGDYRRAFVSYKNAGLVIQDSPTRSFFPDQANKLLKFLLQQQGFGSPIHVNRLGVRSRFASVSGISFEELVTRYATRYMGPSSEAAFIFGSQMSDIGGSVNYTTKYGKMNTFGGPMGRDQLKKFFPSRKDLADVVLYFDIDYFKEPDADLSAGDLTGLVKRYAEESWELHEKLAALIMS